MNNIALILGEDIINLLKTYETDFEYYNWNSSNAKTKRIIDPSNIYSAASYIASILNEKALNLVVENAQLKAKLEILENSRKPKK